ncbi:spore germination protein, partial [Alicyclobacillaceae bacterium I2511]
MPIRRLRTPRKLNTLLHNPEADGAQASRTTANPQRASTSTPQASGVEDTLPWETEIGFTLKDTRLTTEIDTNEQSLRTALSPASDIIFRKFRFFTSQQALLVYVDGLSNTELVDSHIIQPLITSSIRVQWDVAAKTDFISLDEVAQTYTSVADVRKVHLFPDVISAILQGDIALYSQGEGAALVLSLRQRADRPIEEPGTEAVIRGPREGFNENIRTSTSLLRRRLPTPDLKIENFTLGTYSKTPVALVYLNGVVNPPLVAEVRQRLQRIEIDAILESGYIEELIEDNPFSPFPQIQNTERPDVAVSVLLEGRVVLLMEGSPFALMAPINLWGALSAAEDYYERYMITNFLRWLRFFFLFLALLLPSLYVAIVTFHQELLPTQLLYTLAASQEVPPFPPVMEVLMMEVTFEALREAGLRLPKAIGSTISIVGALVIGEAAVQAGIVAAPIVVIVAVTGLASYTIPRYNFAISIRMLRFPLIILAGTLGIFGVFMGLLAIIIHLSDLRSFGVPYLSPIAPFDRAALNGTLVRAPHWLILRRPLQNSKHNRTRAGEATRPKHRLPQR